MADRYTEAGLPTGPDQILVAAGAQNAFALLLRAFGGRGRSVLMEQRRLARCVRLMRVRALQTCFNREADGCT